MPARGLVSILRGVVVKPSSTWLGELRMQARMHTAAGWSDGWPTGWPQGDGGGTDVGW